LGDFQILLRHWVPQWKLVLDGFEAGISLPKADSRYVSKNMLTS
jgi:hypothetical protein